MAGMFIDVTVEASAAKDPTVVKKLCEVCPVDIFAQNDDGSLKIVDDNLDECVLCDLCLDAGPKGTVEVIKLYDKPSNK